MPDKPGLTALILTQNSEDVLEDCLESVRFADEILVVDGGSTDGTLKMAHAFGARVLERPYRNYIDQNNWAIPQATHEWVLSVDSDERVTDTLRESVIEELRNGRKHAGYEVHRENWFMGHPISHCLPGDDETRLFLRDRARFPEQTVHANPEIDGSVGRLRGNLLHYSFRSFEQYIPKFDALSSRAARDRHGRIGRIGVFHLVGRPLGRFSKQYVLRGGFLDGRAGLVFCILSAFSSFLKYAKVWELQQQGGQDRA